MRAGKSSIFWHTISFIFYTVTIFIEDHFSFFIPIPFNRSTNDLKKNPDKLIKSIGDKLAIDKVESFNTYSVVRDEHGKD
jgi:hypothetical protein